MAQTLHRIDGRNSLVSLFVLILALLSIIYASRNDPSQESYEVQIKYDDELSIEFKTLDDAIKIFPFLSTTNYVRMKRMKREKLNE